jgi:hypothetical protein
MGVIIYPAPVSVSVLNNLIRHCLCLSFTQNIEDVSFEGKGSGERLAQSEEQGILKAFFDMQH